MDHGNYSVMKTNIDRSYSLVKTNIDSTRTKDFIPLIGRFVNFKPGITN